MRVETLTIAIPVLNGGSMLAETLEAIAEQTNAAAVEVELLIVDSGSTDGSVGLCERHGAHVIEIDKSQFSHGGTRNLLVGEARGDAVALLTQDATPATPGWLDAIVDAFALADDVALVFGPQLPRPDHSHFVKRELLDHFKIWDRDGEPLLQRVQPGPAGEAEYREHAGDYTFFSDVNGAVAKWAWEKIPYREVPYAEDQLIGREMIEAGFAKVFHPGMAVVHSHDYSAWNFMKRYFDEYRGLREVLGYKPPFGARSTARAVLGLTRTDRHYLRDAGVEGRELRLATFRSLRHHSLRIAGQTLGGRADKLPRALTRRLSLEGRAGFTPVELPRELRT